MKNCRHFKSSRLRKGKSHNDLRDLVLKREVSTSIAVSLFQKCFYIVHWARKSEYFYSRQL